MAPGSANKRKRNDRPHDDHRPSPHRPEGLGMAQRMDRDGGRGRGDRGGRRSSRQSGPADGVNAVPVAPRSSLAPTAPQPEVPEQASTPAAEVSRSNTPLPRVATPAPPPHPPEPKEPPAPYAYDYLSDEVVASWAETGKQSVIESAKEADQLDVGTILQELVRSTLDGRLDAGEAGSVVKQMILDREQQDTVDTQSLFLSTISMLEESDTKNPALLAMLQATNIDPEVMRHDLDGPVLVALRLVQSTFERMKARKTTNMLYRQANFNLLREETEGYAKLLTEYFNIADDAGKSTLPDVAENAFHRIMALVGAFDLDVGRVLDITLDISANSLVKAYAFFIKFYRCSIWWPDGGNLDNIKWEDDGFNTFPAWALPGSGRLGPSEDDMLELAGSKQLRDESFWKAVREKGTNAFFELGARRIVDYDAIEEELSVETPADVDGKGNEIRPERRKRLNETRKYMRETRTLPAPGNSDAAQLLGFKLRFYASPARELDDVMPDNLVHFTALLIKIGFISLRDLYPHLHPADEQMPAERVCLEKEKAERDVKERPGGGPNRLAMASALTDDTLPYSQRSRLDQARSGGATPKTDRKDEAAEEELPAPPNQKIALLKALLALGAVPEAMYILGRFTWLVDVDPSLPPYLLRIIRHMLSSVSETVRPLANREGLADGKNQLEDTSAKPDGTLGFRTRDRKYPTKWLGLEEVSEKDGSRYRYYYTEWADNVPVCQTTDDVFQLCNTLIGFLGVKIGRDATILGTLLRLARRSLQEDTSDSNRSRWLEMMRRLLVPALSLTKHNVSLTDEVYQLLMLFPVTTRYNIYADWFIGRTSRLPEIKVAFDHNRAEVKDVLRRVSNENVKTQARALGKVSFSSPGVLMAFMISQLESYSNMIPALVECTKYFPKLAYDVLTWSLINSLNGQGRNRFQADGMLTSSWLQALSQFVASLFHHYASVNPSPILQYLASELRNGDSTDLEMFEQVLTEMAGIRSDTEFNDAQILAMSGGEYLQSFTMQQLDDNRHDRDRKASAKRLMKALSEPGLVGQTLVAIAQERQMYPHHESSRYMPLKVLGNNLDKIQSVFLQYLDFLRTNLSPEDFEATVPDVVSLIGDFGLPPGIAFTINRAVLAHRMLEATKREDMQAKELKASQEPAHANGDVEMPEAAALSTLKTELSIDGETLAVGDGGPESQAKMSAMPNGTTSDSTSAWHPALKQLIEKLPSVTGDLQDRISIPFWVTFWQLALPDVVPPTAVYKVEAKKLKDQIEQMTKERSAVPQSLRKEHDKKRVDTQDKYSKLATEVTPRVGWYTKVGHRLKLERSHWFDRSRKREDQIQRHLALLQECFLPRAMLSSVDAHYSYLMLRKLHDGGTPGFSTIVMIEQLLRKQALTAVIFQCTGQEAQNLGRFLNEVLKMIASWHAKKEDFEKHALGNRALPGFAIAASLDYDLKDDERKATWNFLEYEDYRRKCHNWHSAICDALLACFESGEYMHIRNGIMVLKSVVGTYPQLKHQGNRFLATVEKLSKEEKRQDLKLMALSLLGTLKTKESQWIMPQAFRLNDPSKPAKPSSRAASARPETPQPGEAAKLNGAAPEFKPPQGPLANGTSRKTSVLGVEDGEVEEEKASTVKSGDAEMKDVSAAKPEPKSANATPQPPVTKSMPSEAVGESQQDQQRLLSKPPTPAPSVAKPPRPAPSVQKPTDHSGRRDTSREPSSLQQLPHSLPSHSRPDLRGGHANKPLPPTPAARPDSRAPRHSEGGQGRLDRPVDGRTGSREHSPGLGSRSRPRSPPDMPRSQSREERPRSGREDSWANSRRDAPASMHSRPHDSRDRVNGAMGPPGPPPSYSSIHHGPDHLDPAVSAARIISQSTSSSSRPIDAEPSTELSQFQVNNERQRIIQESIDREARAEQSRHQAQPNLQPDTRRDRDSRDHRDRDPRDHRDHHRDSRADHDGRPNGRVQPGEPPREPQSRMEHQSTDLAPSGPRKGRLNGDFGREESSYGRLNAPSESPAGPRPMNGPNGAGGRGGRNFSAPHPAPNARSMDQPMPSPTASRPSESHAAFQPPQRPSRNTSFDLRNQGPQPDQRQQQQHSQPFTPGPPTPTHDLVGMNPERLKLFTDMGVNNTGLAQASPTTAPPSGPRGTAGRAPTNAPTGPSPATTAPPSGPSSATDRQRSTRQRGMINSLMQSTAVNTGQTSRGQDVSFRGASSRQNSFAAPSAMNGAPALAVPSEMEASHRRSDGPPRNDVPSRNDGPLRNDGAPRNDGPFRNDTYQNRVESRQDQVQQKHGTAMKSALEVADTLLVSAGQTTSRHRGLRQSAWMIVEREMTARVHPVIGEALREATRTVAHPTCPGRWEVLRLPPFHGEATVLARKGKALTTVDAAVTQCTVIREVEGVMRKDAMMVVTACQGMMDRLTGSGGTRIHNLDQTREDAVDGRTVFEESTPGRGDRSTPD
ncbi:THO2 plays a role in transcriptional elongation [Elasticomyces elasticus]|nr:THO2 plays a role in transcriptional elongation [Elasticomyces elasticus]